MTKRTRIKICGITNTEDARCAVNAGVDAIGMIFASKSPRRIDPEKAREIVSGVPPFVDIVGVFVNEDPAMVNDIVKYCSLTVVQLHGTEDAEYCRSLAVRVLKAVSVHDETTTADFLPYADAVSGFLLDTYHPEMAGGTGRSFDWRIFESLQIPRPFLLAGGLSPANIVEAIQVVRPFGVDVNSGVESEPGRKDHGMISDVIQLVMDTDRSLA
ncbi:MAG: phosphoribosylanthranilate isomerase [Proteobacteria bacterium]|nr:phosphoribosylanthranilate isomerase [Pseudomonadota bacterium]MBU1688857.1 phosphoribosylanthranilate isomerase [Pseudomonadota bacterium]